MLEVVLIYPLPVYVLFELVLYKLQLHMCAWVLICLHYMQIPYRNCPS